MADNLDPQQIQQLIDALDGLSKTLGNENVVKSADIKNFDDLGKSLKTSLLSYNSLNKAIVGASGTLGKLKDGVQGTTAFNNGIEAAGSAIGKFAGLLGTLVGGPLGLFVKGIGLAAVAGSKYVQAVNKQSDSLFKAYQDLSKTGAAGAGGMKEVFGSMQKFGYGIEQLGEMTELLRENSTSLANFGGTVASGTKNFSTAMDQVVHSGVGQEMMMLGKTVDDMNKYGAGYIKQQIMLGRSQVDINKNLAASAANYMKEQDALARLTGDTREAQESKQEEAMLEDRFAATMDMLQQRALAGDKAAEDQMKKLDILNKTLVGEARQEMLRVAGGDISGGAKLMMTSATAVKDILDTTKSAANVLDSLAKESKQYRTAFGGGIALGAEAPGLKYGEQMKFGAQYTGANAQELMDRAKAEQEAAQTTDAALKAQVRLRIEQMNTRDELQKLINLGIVPVTQGMSGLATVIGKITGAPAAMFDLAKPGTGGLIGGGTRGIGGTSALPPGASDVDKILETIKKRESGGNYQAQAAGSTASGAYQFINSTWQAATKKAGIGTEYASAKEAPKEVQDTVAKSMVQDILRQAGGDVSKVPLAWYTGNIQGKMSPEALAANKGLTAETYQSKWMKEYSGISGPSSGYVSSVNGVNPSTSLPTASGGTGSTTSGNNASFEEKMLALQQAQLDHLSMLNRVNTQQLGVQQKQLSLNN